MLNDRQLLTVKTCFSNADEIIFLRRCPWFIGKWATRPAMELVVAFRLTSKIYLVSVGNSQDCTHPAEKPKLTDTVTFLNMALLLRQVR